MKFKWLLLSIVVLLICGVCLTAHAQSTKQEAKKCAANAKLQKAGEGCPYPCMGIICCDDDNDGCHSDEVIHKPYDPTKPLDDQLKLPIGAPSVYKCRLVCLANCTKRKGTVN